MTEAQQQAWVEAARRGDEKAFEQIFFRYQASLYTWARYLVGDPDEAEDVVQKSFIKAFRALPHMRQPGQLEHWLRRIVYTTSIDTLRSRKRRQEAPLDDRRRVRSVPSHSPDGEAILQEQLDLVQRALQRMPERHRAYIILRELEGLSYSEMAEVLGQPLTTVRVALFRAREELRALLRQLAGEENP